MFSYKLFVIRAARNVLCKYIYVYYKCTQNKEKDRKYIYLISVYVVYL